jgi:putative membrane protein
MFVRQSPTLFDILFHLRGSVVPRVARRLAFMLAVSVAAVWLVPHYPEPFRQLGAIPFTLIGLALSIFMNFRNTACYDRWWEGRKLWGQMLIDTRSFARQIAHLPPETRAPLLRGLIGFAHGLGARLREGPEAAAIAPWMPPPVANDTLPLSPNPTDAALRAVGLRCTALAQGGAINAIQHSVLERQLTSLSGVQAGCERIKATPLPFAYSLLLHRTAHIFCLLLPFALAQPLGWWTPLPVLVVSYTFFGLDTLGDELEDPFGTDANDLPLDAMIRTVEREMLAAAGESALPPTLSPSRDILT